MSRLFLPGGVVLLAALTLAAYLPALDGEFVYDDFRLVSMNRSITGGAGLLQYFSDPSTQTGDGSWRGNYRPLRTLSYRLLGGDAQGQHLLNLLIHLANGLLVWALLVRLLPAAGRAAPLLGAAAFLLHPLATEPVAWISGRGDVLAMTGLLAALLLYLREGRGSRAASLLVFLAALLTKESAAILPAGLVLVDGYLGGMSRIRERLVGYVPYVAVLAAYLGIRLAVLGSGGFGQDGGLGVPRGDLAGWLLAGNAYYVAKFLFPVNLFVERRLVTQDTVPAAAGVIGFLLLTGLVWTAVRLRCRRPAVTLAILWFLAALLPVLWLQLLFPLKILVANRFAYPALFSAGLFLAWISARGRPYLWLSAAVLLLAFLPISRARAAVWSGETELWEDVLARDPGNSVALFGLGTKAMKEGRWEDASALLTRAAARQRMSPKLAWFLGECSVQLASRHRKGGQEWGEYMTRALSAYHSAVRLWQGGSLEDRQPYRAVLVDAAWVAGECSRADVAEEHSREFLRAEGPVLSTPRTVARLRELAASFAAKGDEALARGLWQAAEDLSRGGR